jgi:amino acid transporter
VGDDSQGSKDKLTWNGAFTMAVGGMIGGGIFSVLGVVVALAGAWAWASFLLAGVIALLASLSYVALATNWRQGGGLYGFLTRLGHQATAGSVAWILVAGYVLTMAVYAFTFGHYLANVLGVDPAIWTRVFSVAVVAGLVLVNLRGVGQAQWLEEFTVWGKLGVLVALAAIGLLRFDPANLSMPGSDPGLDAALLGVLIGAASIFMAYEGFQLLAYDYDDIRSPERTLPRSVPPAVIVVSGVYIVVALGAVSLVGAQTVVDQKEVALATAGAAALGTIGLVAVTAAAVFSTASAINATLFGTARLARSVAEDGEYPEWVAHRNERGDPDRAVIALGLAAALLGALGGLTTLVSAASLVFLGTFAAVATIAFRQRAGNRVAAALAATGSALAAIVLIGRLLLTEPWTLAVLGGALAAAVAGRTWVARRR